jgi:hypothetical protein
MFSMAPLSARAAAGLADVTLPQVSLILANGSLEPRSHPHTLTPSSITATRPSNHKIRNFARIQTTMSLFKRLFRFIRGLAHRAKAPHAARATAPPSPRSTANADAWRYLFADELSLYSVEDNETGDEPSPEELEFIEMLRNLLAKGPAERL